MQGKTQPELKQVNSPEVTPAENRSAKEAPSLNQQPNETRTLPAPLPPAVGDLRPGEVKTPEGFDELFAMALKVRTGKPGMADFWARMAQADAFHRVALALDRLNEFLGVYDNDDRPDEDSVRLLDVLTAALKKKS